MISIWCPLAFQRLLVLFYMLVFFNLLSSSHATTSDTLAPGQTISDVDSQSLVSANGVFELGFFSPANSTYRYLGVWYRNITPQTVVWVANREAPIADSSGALSISSSTGDLVLLNGRGNVKWSTNSSAGPINTTAYLANKGNLILRSVTSTNGQEFSLWESFDHPVDTFLPGMKISLNRTSGKSLLYTSWKSPDDPSPGNYSLGLDPSGSGQLFMWDGTAIRWRSGQWNRSTFIGTAMRALSLYGFQLITDDNGLMYYTYDPQNNTLLRFVLEWNGVENTTLFSEENQDWITVWVQPTSECEIYGKCGIYGVCNNETTATTCSCIQGFEPKSSEQWKQGKWTEGCVRKTSLSCPQNKSGDGFFTLPGVKVPDHADWDSTFDVQDKEGCQNACLNNCSCKAYALVNGIGCLVWGRDLIDIYQFPQGQNGYDLYVKISRSDLAVPISPTNNRNKSWKTIVIVSTLAGASLLVISFIFWWKCKGKLQGYRKEKHQEQIVSGSMYSINVSKSGASNASDYGGGREKELTELPLFTLSSISAATDNFSDANKLGEGGFGHVYKGELPGGEMVAVKRLSKTSGQGSEEFKNEVLLIAKLQHRNLVRLLGCCIHEEEKILVYEYMPNKSLDAILFDDEKKTTLDWNRRFNIIEGIARGLLYLHRDSRLRVVHRDLKASNILLDSDMNPKISDFGMAKIFGGDMNQDNTGRVVGTLGYMSPEYAMEGIFSDKSDVYSYGILLLEIVTGLKNSSFHQTNSLNIVGHVWQMWNEDRTQELIDPSMRTSCSTLQVMRCIHVGLLCVQDRAGDRPDMQSVILMMGKQAGLLPMPRQPVFVSEESCVPNGFSVNDLTVTSVQGR